EQGFEVAFAETLRAAPLDDLEEQRRPILYGLGENLQQVTLVIAVHEDAQLGQLTSVLFNLSDPLREHLIVSIGHAQEGDIVVPQSADGFDNVVAGHGNVLDAGTAVVLQV